MIRLSILFGLLVLPAMAQDNIGFAAPSGNIACLIGTTFARCDLAVMTHQDFTKPPANCPLDFGAAFEIATDGAKAVALCYCDTVFAPDLPVLDYGQVMSIGGIHCTSEKTGMRCANSAGHGFQIAKARQSLFWARLTCLLDRRRIGDMVAATRSAASLDKMTSHIFKGLSWA